MDSLNVVALTGTLERDPALRFDSNSGTARCSGTLRCEDLGASGNPFRLYVPLEAWGKTAETLGELRAGTLIAVQGKLCWRKYTTQHGEEKGTLAVLARQVAALAPMASTGGSSGKVP
jgi:single-stranded DNA-binding protein